MKQFTFLFKHKSNSYIILCTLLLLFFSPTTLYAAELPTTPIENIPLPTEEAPDETITLIPPTEVPEDVLTEELLPPELPTVENPIPENPIPELPPEDIVLPEIPLPDTPPTTEDAFHVIPADGTYYITSSGGLNVRSGPSIQYDIIGNLPYGEEITITGEVNNDWFEIPFQGMNGYISAKYVSTEPHMTLPLETEEIPEAPESIIEEAQIEQDVMPFISDTTMILLLLAIIAIIVVIVITVFSFFRINHKYHD